jgi:pentatricopeptide repeat protein
LGTDLAAAGQIQEAIDLYRKLTAAGIEPASLGQLKDDINRASPGGIP